MRGRATTPEAEAERRAKIRSAMIEIASRKYREEDSGRFETRPIEVSATYAIGRNRNYEGQYYATLYFDHEPSEFEIETRLNETHPGHRHWEANKE
jgi:hypothetical protein